MAKPKQYHKRVGLANLSNERINQLLRIIERLGYSTSDYRINYYSNSAELIISNRDLHQDLKTARKTTY